MAELTNKGLVKHAQEMLALPTSYMWGTLARKIDQGTIDWCRKTYPGMYSADRAAYLQKQIGKRYGCDCVGLIKSYYFGGVGSPKYRADRDFNTNAIFAAAPEKGPLSTLPEVPGTCLYMQGHVGIYIGEGWCIECTLGNYGDGVVRNFDKGDKVKVKRRAKNYDGRSLAAFVYGLVYDVIEVAGDRVVIGKGSNVTAAVHKKDLVKL